MSAFISLDGLFNNDPNLYYPKDSVFTHNWITQWRIERRINKRVNRLFSFYLTFWCDWAMMKANGFHVGKEIIPLIRVYGVNYPLISAESIFRILRKKNTHRRLELINTIQLVSSSPKNKSFVGLETIDSKQNQLSVQNSFFEVYDNKTTVIFHVDNGAKNYHKLKIKFCILRKQLNFKVGWIA